MQDDRIGWKGFMTTRGGEERRGAHLEQERAESPPVHRLSVALVLQDLRSEVLRSAAEGLRASFRVVASHSRFGQAKVGDPQVTGAIQTITIASGTRDGRERVEEDKTNRMFSGLRSR